MHSISFSVLVSQNRYWMVVGVACDISIVSMKASFSLLATWRGSRFLVLCASAVISVEEASTRSPHVSMP